MFIVDPFSSVNGPLVPDSLQLYISTVFLQWTPRDWTERNISGEKTWNNKNNLHLFRYGVLCMLVYYILAVAVKMRKTHNANTLGNKVFTFAFFFPSRICILWLMHCPCKPTLLGPIQDWLTGVGWIMHASEITCIMQPECMHVTCNLCLFALKA